MRVHIIYCHPSENSLTAEVRDACIKGLENSGKSYTISDLYKKNFSTDMTEAEYLRDAFYHNELPLAADVLAEQELINAADALLFIYPVFWTEAPAKLVGWFDRVWTYGFAYGAEVPQGKASGSAAQEAPASAESSASGAVAAHTQGTPAPMKTLDKALFIAVAGNTEEALREQGRLQAMENVMLADRIYDRAREKDFVLLGGTERNNAKLRAQMCQQHLQTAYRLAAEL